MSRRIAAVARIVILETMRKKDFYVALVLGAVLLGYAARIEFYQISNVHRYLLEMGLNTNKIVCLLDNDPKKQGRRLYGTKLKVASPKVLAEVKDPIVILKAGVYNDEIKKDILENINKSTEFLE